MATHSVERHLGLNVEDYDREIRRLVPNYDEMVAEGADLVRRLVRPGARIVDLGCGTGRLTASLLGVLPQASFLLVDIDPPMLDQARSRLASAGDRVAFVERSFHEPPPPCDVVIASLSLHHVMDPPAKEELYRTIFGALPPSGSFIVLDASVSDDPTLSRLTFDRWAAGMGEHGIDDTSARKHFADWAHEERYVSLRDELEALARAGFAHPECFWRKGVLAIYGALR